MEVSTHQAAETTLGLSPSVRDGLVAAARDMTPVSGLTHNHYKYPARFSPKFVRAAIEAFSKPGDLILDPFVGGGTTMVEALAIGRDCIGVDISSLATFVAEAKTLILTDEDIVAFRSWAREVPGRINLQRHSVHFAQGDHEGYYKNIESRRFWRMRKAVEQALASVIPLCGGAERLARCVVLRTAQWALDARRKLPTVAEFRNLMGENAASMVDGAIAFRAAVAASGRRCQSLCLTRSGSGIEAVPEVRSAGTPRLVLTSPPYPGIHVLYHRWQVDGRKETPAPFLIANRLDGSGESYYTLGHRKNPALRTYYDGLLKVLTSAAAVADKGTVFVQVVAFSEPEWQLDRYLDVCNEAGLSEVFLDDHDAPDRRLWRVVPNRRWHADQKGAIPASQEVVFFHRLADDATPPAPQDRFDRDHRRIAPRDLGSSE
jgi:hypothetical protein